MSVKLFLEEFNLTSYAGVIQYQTVNISADYIICRPLWSPFTLHQEHPESVINPDLD